MFSATIQALHRSGLNSLNSLLEPAPAPVSVFSTPRGGLIPWLDQPAPPRLAMYWTAKGWLTASPKARAAV